MYLVFSSPEQIAVVPALQERATQFTDLAGFPLFFFMNVFFRRSGKVGMVSNGLLVLYEISTFYVLYLPISTSYVPPDRATWENATT